MGMKKGMNMKKEELVYLHVLLAQLKKYFEDNIDSHFPRYEELNITPFQLYRMKNDHEAAIFVLSIELVRALEEIYGAPKLIEEFEKRDNRYGSTGILETLLEKYGLTDKEAL